MKYPPHMHTPRPDAPGKWERQISQGWMKQGEEQRSLQASSNTATRPHSSKTTHQGKLDIEAQQQSHKRPQGTLGTNVHSAYAGISVHNALLNLGPPPPDAKVGSKHLPWLRLTDWELMNLRKRMKKNAKWRPSDEMIKKELGEIGRGPHSYAQAKEEAKIYGVEFLDEDSLKTQGSDRKTSLSDQPFLGPNLGMKLNQAKKRKRETHVPPQEGTTFEGCVLAHAAKEQRLRGSDAATNGRKTMEEPKPDRTSEGVDRMSAGKAKHEGVKPSQKLSTVKLYKPSIEVIEPSLGHGEERERFEAKLDDVKRAADSGSGVDLFEAGNASTPRSDVPPAAPVRPGPKNSDSPMKSAMAATTRPAWRAHANTVVPIDLTDVSLTGSDSSSATSTESHEMSAPPTSLDESPSSESSAESSLGDVSLPPPETHSSDKPPICYGLGLDDSAERVTAADTGLSTGGDQSLVAISANLTDNVSPGKLDSTRTSSSPGRDKVRDKSHTHILTPRDDTRAKLVNLARTTPMTPGPMSSRTPLDRQAREIVFAAVTRAIELGDRPINNDVKVLDEKSPDKATSAVVPPTTKHGNVHGSNIPPAAIPHLHCPSEDEALSNSTSAGNEKIYATISTRIKPETDARDIFRMPDTKTSVGPKEVVPTQALLHGSIPSCVNRGHDQFELKQTIESTVAKSRELGDLGFGHAVQQLYKQSLSDPTIADLLVAVLIREPSPAQSADFASRIRVGRTKYQFSQHHWNAMFWPFLGTPSISTTAPVLPLRAIPAFSKHQSPSTSKPANPHNPMKLLSAHHPGNPQGVVESTDVAGQKSPPISSHNANVLSTSTATSIAPSTAISNPSDSQSSLTDKLTNPPSPMMPSSPPKPRVPIGVPGGSGVMAFNRARRRARISAGESGNPVATQQARTSDGAGKNSVINSNERHRRLRDFVVHGRVT